MLVEVKQPGMQLANRHIEQAEIYAMKSGTKWALLTNGCDWRLFHLSFDEDGGIESVLVFKTDLLKSFKEKPDDVVEKFNLLHKKNFIRGELDKFWIKKTMLIPRALSKALFTEDVLRSICREVNRGADVKVGMEDTAKALKNMFDKEVLADIAELRIRKRRKARKTKALPKKPAKVSFGGKKPTKVRLFKETFEVKSWRELLINVAEKLIKRSPATFKKLADSDIMRGKKSTWLTKNKSLLNVPHKLSNGLYMEVLFSADSTVSFIKKLLKGCGYKETDIKISVKD
jgi:hypothetical protein